MLADDEGARKLWKKKVIRDQRSGIRKKPEESEQGAASR
jgi:hypothetical protein